MYAVFTQKNCSYSGQKISIDECCYPIDEMQGIRGKQGEKVVVTG